MHKTCETKPWIKRRKNVEALTINLYTGGDSDVGDLLDNFRRSVQVNETLVDAHFKAIPSVGTFTGGSLTSGDHQLLGWHTNRSGDVQVLVNGTLFEVSADLFQVGDITRSQGDTDAVNHLFFGRSDILFGGRNVRHLVD